MGQDWMVRWLPVMDSLSCTSLSAVHWLCQRVAFDTVFGGILFAIQILPLVDCCFGLIVAFRFKEGTQFFALSARFLDLKF